MGITHQKSVFLLKERAPVETGAFKLYFLNSTANLRLLLRSVRQNLSAAKNRKQWCYSWIKENSRKQPRCHYFKK
jgi:hypothetical protein